MAAQLLTDTTTVLCGYNVFVREESLEDKRRKRNTKRRKVAGVANELSVAFALNKI